MYADFVHAITTAINETRHDPAASLTADVGEYAGRTVALLRIQRTAFDPTYERSSVTRKLGDVLTSVARITHAHGLNETWVNESLDAIEERGALIWLGGRTQTQDALTEASLLLMSAVTELVHLLTTPAGALEDGLPVRLATFRTLTLIGAVCSALRVPLRDVAETALRRHATTNS